MTALLLLAFGIGFEIPARGGDIDADLANVLNNTDPDQVVSVLLYVVDAVDVPALTQSLKATQGGRVSRSVRHLRVVSALQERASLTQASLLHELDALQVEGAVQSYEPAWIANCIRVDARPSTIEALAARKDVATVFYNYPIEGIEPVQAGPAARPPSLENDTIEPGVQAVRAPEVWAMGYTGSGILVSTLDSGVDGAHPALAGRWRGLDPAYSGHSDWAFYDPVTNWTFPQDSAFHGTHTMGTVCGGAPGNQVGVAPGAEWISAAVIDRIPGLQTIFDAMLAFEWLVDPDGNPETDWDVPNVCSNSWGIATLHNVPPYSEPCDETFWSYIDACEAAGIVVLFSAGNEGPLETTLRRPADRATNDYRTCAVGAINATPDPNDDPNHPVALFSSRGPTYCTASGEAAIKPDIAAPGVYVISSFPGNDYQPLSGTSMASPHVNGVVALMLEACPELTPDEVKQVIYDTAVDLGPPGKDNDYGYGLIDAYEAVRLAQALCSGIPLVEDSHFETAVDAPITVSMIASDYDQLPDPPAALTYIITSLPAAGNTLTDPGNGHVITGADLPYSVTNFGNELLYTPTGGYYGVDSFVFKANDGGVPPDAGDSEPAQVSVLVKFDPPQITTESLPVGIVGESYGPVQLQVAQGQPQMTWSVYLGEYIENVLGSSSFASTGTAQGMQGDDAAWPIALPFSFPYYGVDRDTVYVCSNGFLDFNGADTDATNTVAELAAATRIAPLWDDLETTSPHDIYVDTSVAGQVTIRWDAITHWGNFPCNFSVTLFEDGRIRFDYGAGNTTDTPTIGLSAGDGSRYLLASYNGVSSLPNANSLLFDPPPDPLPDGITLSPSGVLSGVPTSADLYRPAFKILDALDRYDIKQFNLYIVDELHPPTAYDQSVSTEVQTPITVALAADDDGLPDPPGALTYVIESLPASGTLHDPLGDVISSVPYSLASYGNEVVYSPHSSFIGDDSFTFVANDGGVSPDAGDSNLATVSITVDPPPVGVAYAFALDSDPGWTTQGQWEFGMPIGGGSHNGDPTSGYTGSNVYGYNLAGDYPVSMSQTMYLTTTAIDCRGLFGAELRFRRWLGVERQPFDHATVSVSNNGVSWTQLWANPLTNVSDSAWSLVTFDISGVADNQATVYIRWGMGTSDGTVTYPGWNIDDVELWGWQVPECTGDVNGDGTVDLTDLGMLLSQYGMSGPGLAGDVDRNGVVDLTDLGVLLSNYGAICN